jgi:hypothetical protein
MRDLDNGLNGSLEIQQLVLVTSLLCVCHPLLARKDSSFAVRGKISGKVTFKRQTWNKSLLAQLAQLQRRQRKQREDQRADPEARDYLRL